MKKTIFASIAAIFAFGGCATDGGVSPMTHSKEETLSNNSVKGMYLFKIESNTNNITVTARGDGKVSL